MSEYNTSKIMMRQMLDFPEFTFVTVGIIQTFCRNLILTILHTTIIL